MWIGPYEIAFSFLKIQITIDYVGELWLRPLGSGNWLLDAAELHVFSIRMDLAMIDSNEVGECKTLFMLTVARNLLQTKWCQS